MHFIDDSILQLVVTKSNNGSYAINITTNDPPAERELRGLKFEAVKDGFRIDVTNKSDLEKVIGALGMSVVSLRMFEEDHTAESISETGYGYSARLYESVFNKDGEPITESKLFDENNMALSLPEIPTPPVRPLEIVQPKNRKEMREFNHLRISNLQSFLDQYFNNLDYYDSPFTVLAGLEAEVKFTNDPPKVVLASYKPDGEMIFNLIRVYEDTHHRRIVEYEFSTSIS